MALKPVDEAHALQIQAGAIGRKIGHAFESLIAHRINSLAVPFVVPARITSHVVTGDPAELLLAYIAQQKRFKTVARASAISTGALATSEAGKQWLTVNGVAVSQCKSDLVVTIEDDKKRSVTIGVSTKQCNNAKPTNAQLYFSTARGFANLLRKHGIMVSDRAILSLRQFCGDAGFRPMDDNAVLRGRKVDPRRFFWEEIDPRGKAEWERLFAAEQANISRLLFQKAYIDDPFTPEFIIHKTRKASSWGRTEAAIYSIEELIDLSMKYQGFATKPYSVRKGSHKDPKGVHHLAPRFGIIQMQRGGQKQHPEQLQFNLEAGYFYKI